MRVKSIVCVKRVPDTEARIRIAGDQTSSIPRVKFVMNPYDEFAVEAALKHKEAAGAGEVTVLTWATARARRRCAPALAMGADPPCC
jgi:electron transfer flavoprotein beta subunit